MTYKIIDLYTGNLVGTYLNKEKAERGLTHLVHEPNQTRYAIQPLVAPAAKKVERTNDKKESN
tara:strand:- start:778 stop:966 length:189 start_codon:yes stop_codon:yes gene_type:complete